MKKLFALVLMLLPISAMAALPEIQSIADNYKLTDNVTIVDLPMDVILKITGEQAEGEGVTNLIVISCKDATITSDISKRTQKVITSYNLTLVSNINDSNGSIKIYTKNVGGKITEVIVLAEGGDGLGLISISGKMAQSTVDNIVAQLGIM